VDKRRYMRLIAQLEVKVGRISGTGLDEFISVTSKDISVAGVGLTSEARFSKGEPLKLIIRLPDDITVHAVGAVKWVTMRENLYAANGHDFAFGIEFVQISDSDRKEIEKFIAQTGYDPSDLSDPAA